MKLEIRRVKAEVRAAEDGKLAGYLLRWGELSGELHWFRERFERGAFADAMTNAEHDLVALYSHDWTKPLASRDAGRLTLTEDDTGPRFEFTPNDASWSIDAQKVIKAGDVRYMSFGFVTIDAVWETVDTEEIRTVKKCDLWEISPVVAPAYLSSSVEARSIEDVWKARKADAGAASSVHQRSQIEYLLARNNHRRRSIA